MALSMLTTLKEFFGYQQDQDLKGFSNECKALAPEQKEELAKLAKEEMIRRGTHKAADFQF